MTAESDKFAAELKAFSEKAKRNERAIYVGVASECKRSIVDGSEYTGAPGQPVQTGQLKSSWVLDIGESAATISTHLDYAPVIEAGRNDRSELTLRSAVGGFHSVKLTIVGFKRIVDAVTKRVSGGSRDG